MVRWVDKALAIAIHGRQLAEHGGGSGVRDQTLLHSAIARPQQLHACGDPALDLAALAASLAAAIAGNHPFVDGSKRTAHVCYRVFLALNRADLDASEEEKYVAMIALADGSRKEAQFAAWLRKRMRVGQRGRVQEPKRRRQPVA